MPTIGFRRCNVRLSPFLLAERGRLKKTAWEKPDRRTILSPEAVFYLDKDDKEEAWKKLFRFASYVKTLDEVETDFRHKVKYFPIEWQYLRELMYKSLKEPDLVVLKVRQVLATWVQAIIHVWEGMAKPKGKSIIVSKGDRESKAFLSDRCAFIYENLPETWRNAVPVVPQHGKTVSARSMRWENGSMIMSFPSSGPSGRSFTITRATIDEANYIRDCIGLRNSLRPGLGPTGPLTIQSTPYAVESDFEEIVMEAEEGNGAVLFKLPVGCRPDRNKDWQETMKYQLGEKGWSTEFGLSFAIKEENALFPQFHPKVHVVERSEIKERYPGPFTVKESNNGRESVYPVYMAIDPHVTKPTAVLWMMVLPDETWYFFSELWQRGNVRKLAEMIKNRERYLRIVDRVIDPSGNMTHRTGGMNPVSQQLREAGLGGLRTAKRERMGIDSLQARMDPQATATGVPMLLVDKSCQKLIRQFRTAGLKTEQMANKKGGYDFVDCAKYIANARPQYNVFHWEHENMDTDTSRQDQLLVDLRANLSYVKRGTGRKWRRTSL